MTGGKVWRRLGIGALLGAACAVVSWGSIDEPGPPGWGLAKPNYDPGGSAAMLLPSNDTRVNLLLLLADRRGATVRDPRAQKDDPPLVLFPWSIMAERTGPAAANANEGGADAAVPASPDANTLGASWDGPTRCQSNEIGTADFINAVRASRDVSDAEKSTLVTARKSLALTARNVHEYGEDIECEAKDSPLPMALKSDRAREFGAYLGGAQLFYAGQFAAATAKFQLLGRAAEPWVRETAFYMVGRTQLNEAVNRSLDEYGSLAPLSKRDVATAAAAGEAFNAYLAAYPTGRYASSARGLVRRAHWLAGDTAALSTDFGRQILAPKPYDGADSDVDLVEEIDEKLPLPTSAVSGIRDPVLLAVVDLQRMREAEQGSERSFCCGPPITNEEIERQRPLFGGDAELFDYIRAAEAYFVRHRPREVLQLIPDGAHQKRFSYLQFSRQMLRGMALQDLGDRHARAFWLSLFDGAVQPYQRGALELALAMQEERSGRLDLVFAPDSVVRHPIIREMLLEHIAGPDILRQQASRPGVPKIEREVALYMLLTKELRNGMYSPFARDVALLPSDAAADPYFGGATTYNPDWNATAQRPPLGTFGPKGDSGDFGCPALATTASQLAGNPRAVRPQLCLAEFFRGNGFDQFSEFEEPVGGGGLASSRPLFPRPVPYSRLETYKSIMKDPAASPDDRALALNRAIRCYAPVGNNSCDGTEVSLAMRRAWFNRLKAEYPQSRWAKELKYYW